MSCNIYTTSEFERFGGGEPLLYADFICRFREICVEDWKITLETALNVPFENLKAAAAVSDDFIVDIKDCNDTISWICLPTG